ncbi:MAG: hypothetical protein QOF28_2683 [Actinomycetota bacterium]|nr:hypothetical protein [Actinomycetota bacterium]
MTLPIVAAGRRGATFLAVSIATGVALLGGTANAAIVGTVPLATAAKYSVLAGSTVTNTGGSVLNRSLGLWPGTSVTGFPPGHVVPPATINKTNAAAHAAKNDLTTAYINAKGRPVNFTTTSNLANKHLQAGVYSGPSKSPLSLTGPLVLDGAGNLNSVFIFQTDSTLITASASTVTLINGAQECNVFWQVGSSATLGSGSVFRGTIMALASITVNSSVTIHGRALARSAAVTLINDVFVSPTCAQATGGGGGPTVTTSPTTGGTTPGGGTVAPGTPGSPGTPGTNGGPGTPHVVGPPRTGGIPVSNQGSAWPAVVLTLLAGLIGAGTTGAFLNRRVRARAATIDAAPRTRTAHAGTSTSRR